MSGRSSEILAAARGLFARKGYESTSVNDIARTVGVADGAIYRHFPSKRAVLSGVIREFYEPVIDMARYNLAGIQDVRQQLRYLIWLQAKAFAEQPELCRLIIAEARPMEDYYESEIADLNRRYTTLLVDVVATGQADGVFRRGIDPTMVRDLVYGGLEHIAWGAVTGRRTIDPDTVADDLMVLVGSGIDARSGPGGSVDIGVLLTKLETVIDRLEP
ncbi:MAG: TetR family transcriptional regulator [Proteobacteria bacterium]|nr:TetR family transcriptional regulator [Pseudomonadota bacterium]